MKTASEISLSRLKFTDNGTNVPSDAVIIEEGSGRLKKKYVITCNNNNQDIVRHEVKTANLICHNRLKYSDDGTNVPANVEIIEEGSRGLKKKYAIIRKTVIKKLLAVK